MRTLSARERVAEVAARQFGRISRIQLAHLDIPDVTVDRWIRQGSLYRVLPRVYAVGHTAKTAEADLMAAVLYAGPGAMLSHATAAWWRGLTSSRPYMIEVSTLRRCRSQPGIRVHQRRSLDRTFHRGLPVTSFPQTLIDYAAKASLTRVRLALAQADFQGDLNVAAVEAELGSGRIGSRKVWTALRRHQPELANARSGIEVRLFELCEHDGLPLPELNADVAGWTVDALWRHQRLAVELDGPGNHRSPAQIRRDRRKELDLRAARLTVLRYSDEQVEEHESTVLAEIAEILNGQTRAA